MDNPRYFDDYFFTSNVSGHTCPGFGSFECAPPAACARDPNTGRRYCCDTRDVCWTVTQTCAHDGSTTDCGTGDTTWCCVDGREICTRARNQINICWSAAHDLLNNISLAVLNDTYSSLSNAHPSATTWAFDPVKLVAETEPALTASSSTTATSPSSTSSSLPPLTVVASPTGGSDNHDNSHASSGLSGGAIAGIVIGVLAGVAALCAVAFVVLRRRRSHRRQTADNAAAIAAAAAIGGPPGGPTGMAHNPSSSYGGDGSIATSLDNKLRYAAVPQFDAAAGGGGGYAPYDASTPGSSPPPPPPSDTNGPQELPGGGVQHPFELPAHSPP
ncbi:hypothetical protein SPI_07101 [Niveomyces insectorum RCEF 264]|uniref:Uncharacterized protein n=1 Tax=Niveomyces insectorum RCEF 264 TaxID=1081102 RepID=A0A167Q9X8_9HYPO|nr:hypothetical protein SPI_07101 [Niveomyces insectorum RCEF 264]